MRIVVGMNTTPDIEIKNARIARESEKAVLITCTFGDEFRKDCWFPRSQIRIEGEKISATAWILDQKDREHGTVTARIETIAPAKSAEEISNFAAHDAKILAAAAKRRTKKAAARLALW